MPTYIVKNHNYAGREINAGMKRLKNMGPNLNSLDISSNQNRKLRTVVT